VVKYISKTNRNINPFILFSPFLLFYIVLVILSPAPGFTGDEGRYLMFAQNLVQGFYSPPAPDINLWNGPGYPILLMPFVGLHLPLVCITILNGILHYLSVIFLFKTLRRFFSLNSALIFSFFWALYFNLFSEMIAIYTEVFTSFLISLLLFILLQSFTENRQGKKCAVYSGLIMGYIVLTKVIFGYVILLMLVGTIVLWLFNRKLINYKRSFLILLVALGTITPYLLYTYHLTNKIFYLSNSGGMSLYWMSSPDENELGDWHHEREIRPSNASDNSDLIIDPTTKSIPGWNNYIYANHVKDYEELDKFTGVERDDTYKKIAINNIKQYPLKYIKNCISNIERLFFSFPYSYTLQHSILRVILTMPIVVCMLFSLVLTIINWQNIAFPLRFILAFVFIYLGCTILVSTYTRMFTIIVPILLFWIAFIFDKSLKLKLKFDRNVSKNK
jgi:hypothetical protein